MNCRYGLISQPKNYTGFYILFAEIYNRDFKSDINALFSFFKELRFLGSFKAKIDWETKKIISDIDEDINFYKEKFKLMPVFKIIIVNNNKNRPIYALFNNPVLYDISCMVPIFARQIPKPIYTCSQIKKIAIIFPYRNPVIRGSILENIIQSGPEVFIFFGEKSIVKKYINFLKQYGVDRSKIKITHLKFKELFISLEGYIIIGCYNMDIYKIHKQIKALKRGQKIFYLTN